MGWTRVLVMTTIGPSAAGALAASGDSRRCIAAKHAARCSTRVALVRQCSDAAGGTVGHFGALHLCQVAGRGVCQGPQECSSRDAANSSPPTVPPLPGNASVCVLLLRCCERQRTSEVVIGLLPQLPSTAVDRVLIVWPATSPAPSPAQMTSARYTQESLETVIVGAGRFNPAIFTPDWLVHTGLIGEGDAEFARGHANFGVVGDLAVVETEWFRLQVLREQMQLASKGVMSPAIRDLAVGIFRLLSHTPITAVGLNFHSHWTIISDADLFKIGDVFAPKRIWRELFPELEPGTQDVTIKLERNRRGSTERVTRNETKVTLQPSAQVPHGVFLSMGHHIQDPFDTEANAGTASRIVDQEWERAWTEARSVFDRLISSALSEGETP